MFFGGKELFYREYKKKEESGRKLNKNGYWQIELDLSIGK